MTDTNSAIGGAETLAPASAVLAQTPAPAAAPIEVENGPDQLRNAARMLAAARRQKEQAPAQASAPESDAPAEPEYESAEKADNGGESPPVEAEAKDAAVEQLPPVEPPRSWSKEDKELFKGLPRETQERLAERERSRDSDFSRRQQEATERAKALDAERAKVESDRKSTRLNSSHVSESRMPSSA